METARLAEPQRSFRIGLRYGSFLTGRSAAALRAGLRFPASGLVAKAPARSLAASIERNSASCLISLTGHPCPTSAARGLPGRRCERLRCFRPLLLLLRLLHCTAPRHSGHRSRLARSGTFVSSSLAARHSPLAARRSPLVPAPFPGLRLCWPKGPLGRLRRSSLSGILPFARMPSKHRGHHFSDRP